MLTPHRSGFHPSDSCIYQLISIVHNIYADFNHNPSLEVRGNFLDISKAFDKVWHKGFRSFLNDRHQRVVLNGELSDWTPILAGVLQGSILGPLFFLIYINDLPDNLNSLIKLFADDAFLFSTVYDPNHSAKY